VEQAVGVESARIGTAAIDDLSNAALEDGCGKARFRPQRIWLSGGTAESGGGHEIAIMLFDNENAAVCGPDEPLRLRERGLGDGS
jgi:hypothetical protein